MKNIRDNLVGKRRAYLKMAFVFIVTCLIVAGLSFLIDDQVLTSLKHGLTLSTIIILLLIINLVSFLCFMVMFAAYQWIRRDLKPPRAAEDESEI